MKKLKIVCLAFLSIFLLNTTKAQQGFGIRGGVVASDQKISIANLIDANPKSKLGLDLGVVYNLPLSSNFSLQPEIHYTQMGWKVNAFITDLSANFDYIRIPILVKYDVLPKNEKLSLSPFAGPYLAHLVKEDVDLLSDVLNDIPLKKVDVGIDFGLMLNLQSGFFLDVRYMLGLTNLNDLNTGVELGDINNKGISVGVGFIF